MELTLDLQTENELFYYEHLLDSTENLELIKSFYVKEKYGKGLESYLKKNAYNDEIRDEARTYLVKDKKTKELVGYFSLKAGMTSFNEKNFLFKSEFDSLPGVELANFAMNSAYKENHVEQIGIGKIVFIDFIVPLVREIAKYIGVCFLYIYALPKQKLIRYYYSLNFNRMSVKEEVLLHRRIKPRYDQGCIFMYQKI